MFKTFWECFECSKHSGNVQFECSKHSGNVLNVQNVLGTFCVVMCVCLFLLFVRLVPEGNSVIGYMRAYYIQPGLVAILNKYG